MRLLLACIAFLVSALLSPLAQADRPTLFKEGRIGVGADVLHESGLPMASVSLYPVSILTWSHNFGIGATFELGKPEGWNGGIGGILVRTLDENVGTHLNFLLRASYCGRKLCLSFAHISHGGNIGIREEADNYGLNFLFLEYRYK